MTGKVSKISWNQNDVETAIFSYGKENKIIFPHPPKSKTNSKWLKVLNVKKKIL